MELNSDYKGLPENAYRKLKPGENYIPYVPADKVIPEITVRSVLIGIVMSILFSAAAAYLGLKVATVFEAAIPIAILAVGIAPLFKRKSTILENVIIQSIGAASGVIVAGAIFTLPAIFILGLDKSIGIDVIKIFLVSLFGGFLGILFLIPFRKYFVDEMHGEFPFPEATATTEVLVAGEKGGEQAKVLIKAILIGGLYDFMISSVGLWKEYVSTRIIPLGEKIAQKWKIVFKVDVLSAIMGLGYIVGLKYAAIIVAGSFLSWYVLVPLVHFIGANLAVQLPPVTDGTLIKDMTPEMIFTNYVRLIGIGGIAMAGIIGIIKSSGVIVKAFGTGFKEIFKKKHEEGEVLRTQKDLKMKTILILLVLTFIAIYIFFRYSILSSQPGATKLSIIALLVVFFIVLLFTSVAATAIAIVGTNPVSGMTLMTLILSAIILVEAGLRGTYGMMAALLIGGVVCTALSVAGGFITDLKIGYWLGATPYQQERFKFLGVLFASLSVGGVIILLNSTYGFVGEGALPAPQANAMAAVIKTLMSNEPVPWMLYIVGIFIALIVEMVGISPLAFALGMYIPLELNTPLLWGAIIAHFIKKSTDNEKLSQKRHQRGTLIASGFIAGGALMGVISALIKYFGVQDKIHIGLAEKPIGEWLAILMFIAISIYLYLDSKGAKEND